MIPLPRRLLRALLALLLAIGVVGARGVEQFERAGKVASGGARGVARVGIGVGVLQGTPRPDLSSVEGFRAAVLVVRALAVIDPASGGSSGIYLAYTSYAGAVSASAADPAAAKALPALLASTEAQPHLKAAGLELP